MEERTTKMTTEPIFLIIGIAVGYVLCYISTQHAASATERALEVMTSAFNARFGVRTPVITSAKETPVTEAKSSIITDEKDLPKKAQFDFQPPNLKQLRNEAIMKQDAKDRELQRELGLIKDHLG